MWTTPSIWKGKQRPFSSLGTLSPDPWPRAHALTDTVKACAFTKNHYKNKNPDCIFIVQSGFLFLYKYPKGIGFQRDYPFGGSLRYAPPNRCGGYPKGKGATLLE